MKNKEKYVELLVRYYEYESQYCEAMRQKMLDDYGLGCNTTRCRQCADLFGKWLEEEYKGPADRRKEMSKKEWVAAIEELLRKDERAGVESLEYIENMRENEVVKIKYESGGFQRINISGNSHGAILKEITRAVYF